MNDLTFLVYDNILSGMTGDLDCDYCYDQLSKSYILICPKLNLSFNELTFKELAESVRQGLISLLHKLSYSGELKEFAEKNKIEIRYFPNYTPSNKELKLPFVIYNCVDSVDELESDFYRK